MKEESNKRRPVKVIREEIFKINKQKPFRKEIIDLVNIINDNSKSGDHKQRDK
jgi:hypothetical protein